MKHFPWLLIAFFLWVRPLDAQNWLPLVPADQYSFQHSDFLLISNVLQIDSQKVLPSGDLVFFLNRVITDCDSCLVFPGKLANQGQFLQKRMIRKPDGRWVFSGKKTFVLFPLAQPGETWLFDTLQNITASVQSVVQTEVLGEQDSVKTIQLSDGAAVVLSQNHGLLHFPDGNSGAHFELKGIPTRNLGEKLPGWQEFYDFEIGDVLEYERNVSLEPGTPANQNTLEKRVILNRFWDADTLVYTVELFSQRTWQWSGPPFPFYAHGIVYWRIHPALAEPWTDGYPGQFFIYPEAPNGSQGSRLYWTTDTLYGVSQVIGVPGEPFQSSNCSLYKTPEGTEEEVLPCDGCGSAFHRRHSVGLGLTSHMMYCFEAWDYGRLRGWIKNGDTTGIITPDSFFLVSVRPEPLAVPVQVAPNPSAGDWRLFFPETATEELHFNLCDVHGRIVSEGWIRAGNTEQQVSGAALPAGIYLLKIQGKNGVKMVQLLKV